MKTTRTRQWFRSVALGCAMAAGTTAFGEDYSYIWTNGGGDSLYANPENWAAAGQADQQHRWFGSTSIPENATEVEVKFGNSIYQEYDNETPKNREIHVNTGSDVPVVFTAEEGGGANAGTLNVGTFSLPGGILDLRSGTYHFYNDIAVAWDAACTGTLKISGADVLCEYWVHTGRGSGSGNIEVSAGSLTTGAKENGNGNLLLSENGGTGSLKVSGTGKVTVNGTLIAPNGGTSGTVTVEGGELTTSGSFEIAKPAGSKGTLTVKGGTVTINGGNAILAGEGEASVVVDGGTLLAGGGPLKMGGNTLTLKSGLCKLRNIETGTVHFDGGTLEPYYAGANGDYFDAGTVVRVTSGTIKTTANLTPKATFEGSGNLVKTGSSKLDLSNADLSNFKGSITVSEGTIDGMGAKIGDAYYASAQAAFDAAADGATITVIKSAEVAVAKAGTFNVALEDGVTLTVTGAPAFNAVYDADAGIVTSTRVAAEFVYVGPVHAEGHSNQAANVYELRTGGNFTVNGEATALVPGAGDTIVFTTSPWLRFADTKNLWWTVAPKIRIEEGKTLKIDLRQNQHLTLGADVTGAGTLELGGTTEAAEHVFAGSELSCAVVKVGGKFRINCQGVVTVSSNLEGAGNVEVDENGTQSTKYALFTGDNSKFEGSVAVTNYAAANRDRTRVTASASSAKAAWSFHGCNRVAAEYTPLTEEGNYYFGALNGTVCLNTTALNNYNIYVGGRNENCAFDGDFSRGGNNVRPYLYKVGTAKLSVSAKNIRYAVIEDGVLDIAAEAAKPYASLTFKGGTLQVTATTTTAAVTDPETGAEITPAVTKFVDPSNRFAAANDAPIKFDSNGGEHEWATALSGSKGLVKKGEGTLTLAAPAAASFEITVEEGAVVVPADSYTAGFATAVDATAEVAEGFVKLVPATAVAYVGDDAETTYASVAEAVAAALAEADEATVTLLTSDASAVTIPEGKTLTVAENGCKFSGTLTGAGILKFASVTGVKPNGTLAFDNWTGSVVIDWNPGNNRFVFNDFGVSGSTIVIVGASDGERNVFTALPCTEWSNGIAPEIAPAIVLSCYWNIKNGWTNYTTKFAKLSGTGDLKVDGGYLRYYHIDTLDNYTGAFAGEKHIFSFGNIVKENPTFGTVLVKAVKGDFAYNLADTKLNGEAASLCVGEIESAYGVYMTAATVTVGDTTTPYATVADAVAAAAAAGVSQVVVADTVAAAALEVEGWEYDAENGVINSTAVVATIGEGDETQNFASLQAAFDAAGDATVTLVADCAQTVTITEDVTVNFAEGDGTFTGTIRGAGAIAMAAKPKGAIKFSNWTGTFVVGWKLGGGAFDPNSYGVAGSVVKLAGGSEGQLYFPQNQNATTTVNPDIEIASAVAFNDGSAGATIALNRVFGEGDLTVSKGSYANTYTIAQLDGYAGTITIGGLANVSIAAIVPADTPECGKAIVKLAWAEGATGRVTAPATVAVEDVAKPLLVGNDGIYLARASVNGTPYWTVEDAFTAANTSGDNIIVVYDGTDTEVAGWRYFEGSYYRCVAKIGDAYYLMLAEAIPDAANGTIEILGICNEQIRIEDGVTVSLDASAFAFGGVVKGGDTAVLNFVTKPKVAPNLDASWTGTVRVSYAALNGGFAIPSFGNANSTVELAANTAGYFTNASGNFNGDFAGTLSIAEGITATINNGWPGSGSNYVTFGTLTGKGNLTFAGDAVNWNDGAYLTYGINKLDDYTGTLTIGNHFKVEIGVIALTSAPSAGEPYAKVAIAGTGANIGVLVDIEGTVVTIGGEVQEVELELRDGGIFAKGEEPADIQVTDDDCNFTVDVTTAATIADATGVATTDPNFGKAAIAYVVGGKLEDGEIVIPTPTITVADGKATVVYSGDNPHVGDYTVTCTLWSFALADANDSTKWTPVATGGIGANLVDTNATAASKFYKVTVTVTNSQLGNETDSGEGA